MSLTIGEKIKIILKRKNMTVGELAEKIGVSRQNFSNKLSRDNFTENDVRQIASALGCDFEINFILPDNTII